MFGEPILFLFLAETYYEVGIYFLNNNSCILLMFSHYFYFFLSSKDITNYKHLGEMFLIIRIKRYFFTT